MFGNHEFAEDVLRNNIEGFHRYCLDVPMHPDMVSSSLCEMTGYSESELTAPAADAYERIIHPEDRELYRRFLLSTAESEQRLRLQYRLIHKSGRVIYVQDSMVSRRENGHMKGYSTLTDVTEIKRENEALHALNETLPCGILKYTCSETPKVTYVNEQMLRILRFSGKSPDDETALAQVRENIYLLIPPEERGQFRRFLDRVYSLDKPIAGEMTAMRCDGTRVRLYGWIIKNINADGDEEFQSVCVDTTERYDRKRRAEEQSYLRALSQVYDEIIEMDLDKKSVRFLQGRYCDQLGPMAKIPMKLEDAAHFWIENAVVEEDRARVRAAFEAVLSEGIHAAESLPLQLEFRVTQSDQSIQSYIGVFLKAGCAGHLFCCRNITRQQEAEQLKLENSVLRDMTDQMRELVMRFTDGMLAFEIRSGCVRPMYFSDNICQFFGYDEDEWLASMQAMTPIREFVSKCHITYDDFLELLENREAEFNYTDVVTGGVRRIKAICTARSEDGDGRCYVMLYDVTDRESTETAQHASAAPNVYIRMFGYFDVFVNDNPIAFRNEKAKELFALLVDRRGGFVTSSEAISLLWEDEPASPVTLARYRKVALRLKNTLEEYGIADIVESVDGKRRIVSRLVRCDLYDYLSGDPQHAQLFKGSYLQNYSWGENTLAELSGWNE